jgi:hypothetical protein
VQSEVAGEGWVEVSGAAVRARGSDVRVGEHSGQERPHARAKESDPFGCVRVFERDR